MVNPDIVNYLKEGTKRGFSISLLKDKLIEGGFSSFDVDLAINELNPIKPISQPLPSFERKVDFSSLKQAQLSFFEKLDGALHRPQLLFNRVKEEGFSKTLSYNLLFMLLPFILSTLAIFSFILYIPSNVILVSWWHVLVSLPSGIVLLFALISCFVVIPLIILALSLSLHLFVIIFRGDGGFTSSYKTIVYSAEPVLLWVPFAFVLTAIPSGFTISLSITALTLIWSLIISLFALESYHNYSKLRSFFSSILGLFLFVLILAAIIFTAAIFGPQKLTFN